VSICPQLRVALVLIALAASGSASASTSERRGGLGIARPTQYVTDETGRVLSEKDRQALNERLAAFERETSNQVVFYLARRQPAGTKAEAAALLALDDWQAGQAGLSNGVVLMLFVEDRTMGLAVGAGLDAALSADVRQRILLETLRPQLRSGNFRGGLYAAAAQILASARQAGYRGKGRTVAETRDAPARPAARSTTAPPPRRAAQTPAAPSRFGPGTAVLLVLALAAVGATVHLNPFDLPGLVLFATSGLANTVFLVYASLNERTELVAGSLAAFVVLVAISGYRTQDQIAAIRSDERAASERNRPTDDDWRRDTSSSDVSSSSSSSSSGFSGGGGSSAGGSSSGSSW
jgi:uncharacterized protein